MAKEKPAAELSYEQALTELENVLEALEKGESVLEETLGLYERGKSLLHRCRDILSQAELRVSELNNTDEQVNDLEDRS